MEKEQLEKKVKDGIMECQNIILRHPTVVLSEADFERLLCHCISKEIGDDVENVPRKNTFSVHTQISHYNKKNGKYAIGERVDILALDENQLQFCKDTRKEKYYGTSVALELKYLHIGDGVSIVDGDFKKWEKLKVESSLFVVILLESTSDRRFATKRQLLLKSIASKYIKGRRHFGKKLYCYILKKLP